MGNDPRMVQNNPAFSGHVPLFVASTRWVCSQCNTKSLRYAEDGCPWAVRLAILSDLRFEQLKAAIRELRAEVLLLNEEPRIAACKKFRAGDDETWGGPGFPQVSGFQVFRISGF